MPIIEMGPGRFYDTFTGKMYASRAEAENPSTPLPVKTETKNGMDYTYYSDGSVTAAKSGSGLTGFLQEAVPELAIKAGLTVAGADPNITGALGQTLAPSLSTATQQAIGTSLVKGVGSELSGGDFLTGALTGGLSTPISSSITEAVGGGMLGSAIGQGITSAGMSALTGGDVGQALLMGGIQGAAGYKEPTPVDTEGSFIANDAAQLAAQGLSEQQIAEILNQYVSTPAANLAASMAVNAVDIPTMGTQLDNLSSNVGLTNTPISDAELAAADALQLHKQVGFNAPAIEQNLVASGLDPLIAADITQQIGLNPNISLNDLSYSLADYYGNDLYGKTIDQINSSNTASATKIEPETTTDWGELAKGLGGLLGGGLIANTVNASSTVPDIPAYRPLNNMPVYDQAYYQQLQNYYDAYAPANAGALDMPMMKDWYSQSGEFNPGASISLPSAPAPVETTPTVTAAGALSGLTSGSSSSDVMAAMDTITDPAQQLQALQNPVVQAALGFMPFGLGGALGGYVGADAANQFNQIAGLYGGQVPGQVSPVASALMGLFGFTPDAVQAASTLAGQFSAGPNSTGVFAGYMQAGTDPVLGGIVNALASQAGPNGLTPVEYGTIGQAIGQQINEVLASTTLSYPEAAAVVASSVGVDPGTVGGLNFGGVADTGMATNAAGQTVSNAATIAAQDAANFGLSSVTDSSPSSYSDSGSYSDSSSTSDSGYSGGSGWSSSDYSGGWSGY